MIRLDEVAKKLENILNGNDEDALDSDLPLAYEFRVETDGFHIDHIVNKKEQRNFIPVFISSMGGQFNPVPELLQANYVIPISFYFPVRFKNDLLVLNEYLARVFVGKRLNYGKYSGRALSNISVAQFGEIQDLDLNQFVKWVNERYEMPIEKMEAYLQMTIDLYLSTASEDFVYGNDASATLSISGSGLDPEELVFVENSIQSNSDPALQQLLGASESEGRPTSTAYGASFSVYIKDNEFFQYLIEEWFEGRASAMTLTLTLTFLNKTFQREVFIHNVNLVTRKGELATITLSFSKRAQL